MALVSSSSHLIDQEVLFPRSSMSQNRGFTRGFIIIARFLILMTYDVAKKSGPNDCVVILSCRSSEGSQLGGCTVLHCISHCKINRIRIVEELGRGTDDQRDARSKIGRGRTRHLDCFAGQSDRWTDRLTCKLMWREQGRQMTRDIY